MELDRSNVTACLKWLWKLPRLALMTLVRSYQLLLSPWLGTSCRFEPTCSAYSLRALQDKGAVIGTYLTLHRLVRCNPWCDGGHDPVDPAHSNSATPLSSSPLGLQNPSSSSEKTLS